MKQLLLLAVAIVCLQITSVLAASNYCQPRSAVCVIIDDGFCSRALTNLRKVESSSDYRYAIKASHGDQHKLWTFRSYQNAMSFRAGLKMGKCKSIK